MQAAHVLFDIAGAALVPAWHMERYTLAWVSEDMHSQGMYAPRAHKCVVLPHHHHGKNKPRQTPPASAKEQAHGEYQGPDASYLTRISCTRCDQGRKDRSLIMPGHA